MNSKNDLTYQTSGVDVSKEETSLSRMLQLIKQTFCLRKGIGAVKLDIKYFANVIDIGHGLGIALSTDGVGTKILVAQMMGKYDTVGIDCVAMNVNDVICVGAEPLSMLDYLAIENPDPNFLVEIAKGLCKGCEISKITLAGGELSQIKEMIKGKREGYAFDLVGMCIGIVPLDKIIIGQNIVEGDAVIGLASSGIHSNGLTLARRILFDKMGFSVNTHLNQLNRLGKTIGEELLEPTHIYVPEVMEMLKSGLNIKALINITSDGLLNLLRVESKVGFIIDHLPEPQPIFNLIQEYGNIPDEEMYIVYNMGVGFCVVVDQKDADQVMTMAKEYGVESFRLGSAVDEPKERVIIKPKSLISEGNRLCGVGRPSHN